MPQIQVPDKGLRKRRNTTAISEDSDVRKRATYAREEQEEREKQVDMSDMLFVKIKEIQESRRRVERQKTDNGMRLEKKARMRPRPHCCACGERSGVKPD